MIDRCRNAGCQDADWDLFAMGSLDAEVHRQMEEHLRSGCVDCRRSHEAAMELMTALACEVPQVEPSAGIADALRSRIVGLESGAKDGFRLGASPFGMQPLRIEPRPAHPRRMQWSAGLPWSIAAALALLALWLGVSLRHVSRELAESHANPIVVQGPVPAVANSNSAPAVGGDGRVQVPEQAGASGATGVEGARPVSAKDADASRVRALTEQLTRLQAERDAAVARWNESQSALAQAVAARGALQAQLTAAQEQAASHSGSSGGPGDAQAFHSEVAALTAQLNEANATVNALRGAIARDGRILAFFRAGPSRQIELKSIDAGAGGATGVAYYAPDRGLMVMVRNLPQLPGGECYQLWSVHKSGTSIQSVGLMATDGSGGGYLFAGPSNDLRQLTALTITDEPKGGSLSARGRKLLFGVLD